MSVRQHEEERQQREQFLKKENEILNRHKGELIEQKWILEMENNRLREALENTQSEIIPIRGYERKDIDGITSVCIKICKVLEGEEWE